MKRLILENKESVVNQIRSYLANNPEAKFIYRLQAVLLFAEKEDESCDSLGALFGNSPRSISNWIKKVNRTGDIKSLRSKPTSGRPPRLSKAQKDEIKMILRESPGKWGMDGRRWSGSTLSLYISRHYGISLKVRSCQRLFRKLCPINRI
jgi:transposase